MTHQFAGIDKDVEKIFLSLSQSDLERILASYGQAHGLKAEAYARETYVKWKTGEVKMSGQTAARLLELLPPVLPASARFELIKKLRAGHFKRTTVRVQSTPLTWRQDLAQPIRDLIDASAAFSLPDAVISRANWLTDGDAVAARRLLVAAEQQESAIRLAYIDEELRRIEALLQDIDTHRRIIHTLQLPQGEIILTVELPQRSLLQRLTGWLR